MDVIVIGAGPAGITAGLYLHRSNFQTLILHNNTSSLQKDYQIDNYYGESTQGEVLYKKGINQANALGIEIKEEDVIEISYNGMYQVKTNKEIYEAKYLVLATGKKKKELKIPGLKDYVGEGVSYCAVCDAFFYKGKVVAVIGDGLYAEHEKEILEQVCAKVYLLSHENNKITKIKKSDQFEIYFENETVIEVDGVFVALGISDTQTLSSNLGIKIENGFISVDENQKTNLPNCYACGDVTGGVLQISSAVNEGMKVALAIIKNRKEEKK